jgi:hypothetical protein
VTGFGLSPRLRSWIEKALDGRKHRTHLTVTIISGETMSTKRAWSMPKDEPRSLLRLIEERIRSSEIEVERRDALIRLRQVIEEEVATVGATSRDVGEPSKRHAA